MKQYGSIVAWTVAVDGQAARDGQRTAHQVSSCWNVDILVLCFGGIKTLLDGDGVVHGDGVISSSVTSNTISYCIPGSLCWVECIFHLDLLV